MAQLPTSQHDAVLEKAWGRIGHDGWHQMAWLVKLANTDLKELSPGDIKNLQDECEAIRMVPISFYPIPSDRKRYPFLRGWISSQVPTLDDLQNIKASITPHLNNIADDREIVLGPVAVSHRIKFRRSTEAEQKAGYRPTLIWKTDILSNIRYSWPDDFLLRTARLLEEFVDGIHRCPHCNKVFLQIRRNAKYCGRSCHSVAYMRHKRALEAIKRTRESKIKRRRQVSASKS